MMRVEPNVCRGSASTVATMLGMIACRTSRSLRPCAPGMASSACITTASLLCRSGSAALALEAGTLALLIGYCGAVLAGAGCGFSTAGEGPREPGRSNTKNQIAMAMITRRTMIATHCAADLMAILLRWRDYLDAHGRQWFHARTSGERAPITATNQCVPPLARAVLPDFGVAPVAAFAGEVGLPAEPGGGKAVELPMAFGCAAGAGREALPAGTLGGGPPVVVAGA